ncbi:ankyrin repeat domain-containing protein [Legionella sp. WA2022007384]
MSESLKKLLKTISERTVDEKNQKMQLKVIEEQAQKILKKHKTLDLFDEYSFYGHTPLEAAINSGSVAVFQLLIQLGASPFYKPKPEIPSALELLANDYFSLTSTKEKTPLFKWVMKSNESPVFTWEKLYEHQELFEKFKKANLIPKKIYINELPLHVAIKAGRMDLVQDVIFAAGGIQKAGDICRMSVLHPAIMAVLDRQENSLPILKYLLQKGANPQISDELGLPAIMQAISARVLYRENAREDAVLQLVKTLLEHGATLNVTNPNNGHVPLMSAMNIGFTNLFYFLLDKADATTLNHRAKLSPCYLIFQLFEENKLRPLVIQELLSTLKEKGLEFNKTIDRTFYTDPFNDPYISKIKVSAKDMTILHFYLDRMQSMDDPIQSIDKHLEIIQALIAHGADVNAKATFILTEEVSDESSYRKTKEVQTKLELTAAQFARKIADKIINRYDFGTGLLIKTYRDENEFLMNIDYYPSEEQTSLHKKFHNFRNLERVLSGEKPLPYAGLPNSRKMATSKLKKQNSVANDDSVVTPLIVMDLDPKSFEAQLINARTQQNQSDWQELKQSLVTHVKGATSLEDFLAKVEYLKKPLQLHFNITTNTKGEVISCGSTMYRFFHYFDPYKFPNSWETLRKFGKDTYGVDINTQYEQNTAYQFQ